MNELTAKEARSRYNNTQLEDILKNIQYTCPNTYYYKVYELSKETKKALKDLGYKISRPWLDYYKYKISW